MQHVMHSMPQQKIIYPECCDLLFTELIANNNGCEVYRATLKYHGKKVNALITRRTLTSGKIIWWNTDLDLLNNSQFHSTYELQRVPFARRMTRKVTRMAIKYLSQHLNRDIIMVIIDTARKCEKKTNWVCNPAVRHPAA